jgi:protein-S-isoprenylcysteine O-methyltransferase Ste14
MLDASHQSAVQRGEPATIARFLVMLYAILSYGVFLISVVWAIGFVGNIAVPKSIDVGGDTPLAEAVIVDMALLGLFAVQHSTMARASFKRRWVRIVPPASERSSYVLLSSPILLLLFWQWRPIPPVIWQVDGWAAHLLVGCYWVGWLIVFASNFMIDHFELIGLRQSFDALRGTDSRTASFKMPLFYRLVRHPLMLGFLVAFWATPVMTAGHLLFAVMTTGYILAGLQLEERDLKTEFGAPYEEYRARVPMLVPFWPKRRH